jgi:TRAP-type C4-dicarboxylate transport system permease small subunit
MLNIMAARDKLFGAALSLTSLGLGAGYFYALFGPGGYALWAMSIAVSALVVLFLLIFAWAGWVIMTSPTVEELEEKKK